MSTHRLDDGTSSIDISPIEGYNEPENRVRENLDVEGGFKVTHEYGGRLKYEFPMSNISETNADLMISWWENMTTLTFTPDLQGAPGTTVPVQITEIPRPIQMWGGDWDTLFAGMITLHQFSSISFSSSSESISGSKSCSESYSESQSVNPKASCSTSAWVSTGVAYLSSCSDSSASDSESCSDSSASDSRSCSTSVSVSSSVSLTGSSCSESSASNSESCSDSSASDSESCSAWSSSFEVTLGSTSCSQSTSGSQSESQSCSVSGAG